MLCLETSQLCRGTFCFFKKSHSRALPNAMSSRFKNLHGTRDCSHYRRKEVQDAVSQMKGCARNNCPNKGNPAVKISQCHVIKANQNADSGVRYLVPMCTACNQDYEVVLQVDGRLADLEIKGCTCGHLLYNNVIRAQTTIPRWLNKGRP